MSIFIVSCSNKTDELISFPDDQIQDQSSSSEIEELLKEYPKQKNENSIINLVTQEFANDNLIVSYELLRTGIEYCKPNHDLMFHLARYHAIQEEYGASIYWLDRLAKTDYWGYLRVSETVEFEPLFRYRQMQSILIKMQSNQTNTNALQNINYESVPPDEKFKNKESKYRFTCFILHAQHSGIEDVQFLSNYLAQKNIHSILVKGTVDVDPYASRWSMESSDSTYNRIQECIKELKLTEVNKNQTNIFILLGVAQGGRHAVDLAWKYSDQFQAVISFSIHGKIQILQNESKEADSQNDTSLYLFSGRRSDLEQLNDIDLVIDKWQERGWSRKVNLYEGGNELTYQWKEMLRDSIDEIMSKYED